MGVALLTITKELDGQEWSNTWGISQGTNVGPATPGNIESIILTNPDGGFTSATTDPVNGSYGGADSVIAALLAFERLIHQALVKFTRLNLSDATTPGTPTGPFWSQAISINGLLSSANPVPDESIAPLSIALLVNRNTTLIGVRPGRLYYRGCLNDQSIKPGSRVGVTWASDAPRQAVSNNLEAAVASSLLNTYFYENGSGAPPPIGLVIPSFTTNGEVKTIDGGAGITSLSVNKPVSRQLTRGRRRRVVI